MSVYDKNHYNIVISLQLIRINDKKKKNSGIISEKLFLSFMPPEAELDISPICVTLFTT